MALRMIISSTMERNHSYCIPTLPSIWEKAGKVNVASLPEKPHIAPGEKRYDISTKRELTYYEFEEVYSWFADSVWESSKRI